ncbi:MAG: hypothetical protein JSV23_10055 [Promethearchaeota archaeon]|nr:MAG: hypothetical protein JSV23_10055 [Candidatus Lokiarchaeota archaeon]
MAWGGSLNKNGSDYIRKLREADRVTAFLENLKEDLNSDEQKNISKAIDIITDYISKISQKKE